MSAHADRCTRFDRCDRSGRRRSLRSRAARIALIAAASFGIVAGSAGSPALGAEASDLPAPIAVSVTTGSPAQAASFASPLLGTMGARALSFQRSLAEQHPMRLPFTTGERAAAEWIAAELAAIGFTDQEISVQEFDSAGLTELQQSTLERLNREPAEQIDISQNVVLRIPGSGAGIIVVGANYDAFQPGDLATDPGAGSSVALLLEAAQRLRGSDLAQTVYLGFFGGDTVGLTGSRYFFDSLPETEARDIRLVTNVDAIGNAESLFFTAAVCDGGARCDEKSDVFAERVTDLASAAAADLVLFKEDDFYFGEVTTCLCCTFGISASLVGVPVVNFFAFDFVSDDYGVGQAVTSAQTARALASYQALLQELLHANLPAAS